MTSTCIIIFQHCEHPSRLCLRRSVQEAACCDQTNSCEKVCKLQSVHQCSINLNQWKFEIQMRAFESKTCWFFSTTIFCPHQVIAGLADSAFFFLLNIWINCNTSEDTEPQLFAMSFKKLHFFANLVQFLVDVDLAEATIQPRKFKNSSNIIDKH